MFKGSILLLFTTLSLSSFAQDAELAARIKAVEEGFGKTKYRVKGIPSQTIQDKMAYYRVHGLSIAVIKDYKVDWAKGYGWADVEAKKPVEVNTLFEPGSISKSLNGMTLMRLVQEKKIDLNADINKSLKSWKFPYDSVSNGKVITLAHLLSHTAGLTVHGFLGYKPGDVYPTIPQVLDGISPANSAPVRSYAVPGGQMEYSGGGTMISELMAMDVSGKAYDELVAQKVFAPLAMNNSFFTQPVPANRLPQIATGYNGSGVEIKGKYPVLIEQAAGGLWTTPSDLALFMIEVQLSAQGKSNKVLNKKSTELMLKPYLNPQAGLGVFIEEPNGHKYFSHSAGNLGFSGKYIASLEDGNGVVVFINSDAGGGLIEEVILSVAQAYQWKGVYKETKLIEVDRIDLPVDLQKEYAGTYKDGFAVATITQDAGKMWFTASFNPWEAHFINTTEFVNLESGSLKQFERDANGKITGFKRLVDGKTVGTYKKIELQMPTENELDRYLGKYQDKDQGEWLINREGTTVYLELYGSKNQLHFISAKEFYLTEDFGVVYEFIVKDDKVIELQAHSARGENVIQRIN